MPARPDRAARAQCGGAPQRAIVRVGLHQADLGAGAAVRPSPAVRGRAGHCQWLVRTGQRSEEHTSELQSPVQLVCRLLLEKKKKTRYTWTRWRIHEIDTCYL